MDLSDRAGTTPYRRWLLAVCGLSIAVKIALLMMTHTWGSPRIWEYEAIAVNVLQGEGFHSEFLQQSYRSEVQPVYPLLCVVLYRLFGHSGTVVQVAQVLLATLLCIIVYDIGRRLFSARAGLVSAVLVAVHPGLSYYATANLHVLVLDALLFAMVVWAFLYLEGEAGITPFVIGGLSLGTALLSRASVLAFLPAGLVWIWWRLRLRLSGRQVLGRTALMLGIAALIVSPWLMRNYRLHGRPFYFLSTVGSGLWTGNNPQASGSTLTPDGRPIRSTAPQEFLDRLSQLSEVEQDDYLKQEAIAYMTAHPWRTVRLFAKKFWSFWWFSPQSGLWYPRGWLRAYQLWYVVVLLLVGVGLYGAWTHQTWSRVLIIPLFGLSIAACQSLFYVEGRHRWEVEALLLVLASGGLILLMDAAAKRMQSHVLSH